MYYYNVYTYLLMSLCVIQCISSTTATGLLTNLTNTKHWRLNGVWKSVNPLAFSEFLHNTNLILDLILIYTNIYLIKKNKQNKHMYMITPPSIEQSKNRCNCWQKYENLFVNCMTSLSSPLPSWEYWSYRTASSVMSFLAQTLVSTIFNKTAWNV